MADKTKTSRTTKHSAKTPKGSARKYSKHSHSSGAKSRTSTTTTDRSGFEEVKFEKMGKAGTGFLSEVYVYKKTVNGKSHGKIAVKQDKPEWVHFSAQENEWQILETLKQRLNDSAFEFIVRPHRKQTIDEVPSLVLEYLEGGDLEEYAPSEPPGTEKERKVVRWIRDTLVALVFLHSADIIHRDVKPANIVRKDKEGSRVKLVDFGSAGRLEGPNRTSTSRGSFEYRSPEGHLSNPITEKADMFTLGLATYEILIGKQAFPRHPGEDLRDVAMLDRIQNEEPDYDPIVFRNYSREAFLFIRCLLSKNPALRPDAMTALRHEWFKKFDVDPIVKPGDSWWLKDEWKAVNQNVNTVG